MNAQLDAQISTGTAECRRDAITILPTTMDARTLRQILREEIAVVHTAFDHKLETLQHSMDKQTADLTASYQAGLNQVRQEQKAMHESNDAKWIALHDMMQQLNIDGSRPSTTTSQQTFTSHGGDPQQLPDEFQTDKVVSWNALTGAPLWAPGAEISTAQAAMQAQASGCATAPHSQSVPMDLPDQERCRKRCVLCQGKFKHKRGARQHMMKAFQPNAMCKFIPGYAPHDNILIPFQQALAPGSAPETAWRLAVRTLMKRSA
jgi:hypothetical protein